MLRIFFLLITALFFHGCSCEGKRPPVKIGIDPYWYPIDFGAQNSYINGFVEEFLLDIAELSGMEFEWITANWDSLLEGMQQGRYHAVISSLPLYDFNTALYDFSYSFLDLGPVLILPEEAHQTSLEKMPGEHIGVIAGDPAVLILQKHAEVIVRNYPSIPELLEAVVNGEIDGALLDRVEAGNFVSDLYMGRLKIVGAPLNDLGFRLVVMKGKQSHLLRQFNKDLAYLKKKKRLQTLLRKWQLGEMT